MIDFYAAHFIAREEHKARARALERLAEYGVSARPAQPGWASRQVGGLLVAVGSALALLDGAIAGERRASSSAPRADRLKQQPDLK
jgi:hypothetical protein